MLNDLKVEKRTTVRKQITDYIRDEIMRGKLTDGTKLPPIRKLARQWETPLANIHAALAPLVKEGLLVSKHGVGTLVCKPESKLQAIAIYIYMKRRHSITSMFNKNLLETIHEELSNRKIAIKYIHENFDGTAFKDLEELAASRQVQGVIVFNFNRDLLPRLRKLPIPFSCMTSRRLANRVQSDYDQLIDQVVEAVHNNGGNKLGIISSLTLNKNPMRSGERERYFFYKKLFERLAKENIESRPEWQHISGDNDNTLDRNEYDKFAFDAFNKIWKAEEKPDTLFVYSDELTTGTLLAITCKGIKVPDELKLIFHYHNENKKLYPLPCTLIEDSIAETGKKLIDIIEDQFYGREISSTNIDFKTINHNS